ncbi:putative ribonuclease H-like domain-containing protein [Tanacetum coccineum]
MESISAPMVAAAKLLVLNPNEFELWKMRIEQYFLMTDYALWEVIVNGDSPPPKKTIDGVEQTYPPTTAEEKLARKNELKQRIHCSLSSSSSDSEVSTCSKSMFKSYETLKEHYDNLTKEFNSPHKMYGAYKEDLESVEARHDMLKRMSFNHLIKDCDFYEKKMVEKPVWNNASRVNHQNSQRLTHPHPKGNFVPKAVLMKSGHKTLNTARQNSSKAAVSVNTARPINTAYLRPIVNSARTVSNVFNRAHSHVRRPFNKFTTNKNSNLNEKVNTVRRNVTTVGSKAVVSDNKGNKANVVKASACWVWRPKQKKLDHVSRHNGASMNFKRFDYEELKDKGVINSGCFRHMTGNRSYFINYEEINGGFVAFGGSTKGGKITRKGKIRNGKLDIEVVYFVKELKFNLFSVSQMCDKKNNVLFTHTECVVLSPDFKLTDESHVLLKVPRNDNMYNIDLKNVVPQGGLTCLFTKDTPDESNLWHWRLGHVNFKTINKLVKGNLVRGLPSKLFEINQTCVAYQKGKQHIASCIENLIDLKVKVIRCDNETEFKNKVINQFCEMKGIKREFSVARTPQQNRVAERKNKTLIEAVRTMLADSKLPTTFWAEVVNTSYYVQNRDTLPKSNHSGSGPTWLFDIDTLTKSMNYEPVVTWNQSNGSAGTKTCDDSEKAKMETVLGKDYILLPFLTQDPPFSSSFKNSPDAGFKPSGEEKKKNTEDDAGKKVTEIPKKESGISNKEDDKDDQDLRDEFESLIQQEKNGENDVSSTNKINTVSSIINAAGIEDNAADEYIVYVCADDPNMPNLEEIVFSDDDEGVGVEDDMTNLDTHIIINPIPTTRIYKDNPVKQIIGDIHSPPQTRRMTKSVTDHNPSWIEAMQDELLQFKLQKVKQAIRTKWVYKNKKVERGIVVRNKARLVAQCYTQEEMDVKSTFLYGKIKKEVYVYQPLRFEDPEFPDRVYKVEKVLYGLHQAHRTWKEMCTEFEKMMHKKFQMSSMGELTFFLGLQVTQKDDGIFISQDKYMDEILKKFSLSIVRIASTPMETSKPLLKDTEAEDVDVYLYRSMIGSLMYLTAYRLDIMFDVCACARFQVIPKVSHLHAVKRIFRYLIS